MMMSLVTSEWFNLPFFNVFINYSGLSENLYKKLLLSNNFISRFPINISRKLKGIFCYITLFEDFRENWFQVYFENFYVAEPEFRIKIIKFACGFDEILKIWNLFSNSLQYRRGISTLSIIYSDGLTYERMPSKSASFNEGSNWNKQLLQDRKRSSLGNIFLQIFHLWINAFYHKNGVKKTLEKTLEESKIEQDFWKTLY
jgi:hypothetical protein